MNYYIPIKYHFSKLGTIPPSCIAWNIEACRETMVSINSIKNDFVVTETDYGEGY